MKITIDLPAELLDEIDLLAKQQGVTRDRMIAELIEFGFRQAQDAPAEEI